MNLLPDIEKEWLKKGLRQRFVFVLCHMTTAAFIVGLVALLPGFMLARTKYFEVTGKAEAAVMNGSDAQVKTLLNLPAEINSKLQIFRANTPLPEIVDYIFAIVSAVERGILVESLSFTKSINVQDKQTRTMTIAGVASERKNLIEFAEKLKQSEFFELVDVPVSNLTKDRNLPFNIKLTIKE